MTLLELADVHEIRAVYIIAEDGVSATVDWNDATREKFGHVRLQRIGQRLWESPWQTREYPQETVAYGVVVAVQ